MFEIDRKDNKSTDIKNNTQIDKKPEKKIKKLVPENNNENENKNENENENLTTVQKLNTELFGKHSNKSRNSTIKNAWKTLENYVLPDEKNIIIQESHPGHFVTLGCSAGSLKNPYWKVMNMNGDDYYIMNCGGDNYTYFSVDDYTEIINPT